MVINFMLKLEDINNAVYFAFRKSQTEAMKTERLGVIHVSDIIKPCMRNTIYKKTLPDTGMTTEDMRSLYFGQVVHSSSMMAEPEFHEMFFAYDYVRDESLTKEEALKISPTDPRQLDIIYGSVDDVLKIDGKYIICDKKTTGSISYFQRATSKPSESHVDQINRYKVLLKKCYNIDSDHGCVVYISNNVDKESRDKPVTLSFKLAPLEETLQDMIIKAREIKDSLTSRTYPPRVKNYLCDGYCPYATKCFSEDKDTF